MLFQTDPESPIPHSWQIWGTTPSQSTPLSPKKTVDFVSFFFEKIDKMVSWHPSQPKDERAPTPAPPPPPGSEKYWIRHWFKPFVNLSSILTLWIALLWASCEQKNKQFSLSLGLSPKVSFTFCVIVNVNFNLDALLTPTNSINQP